MNRKKQTRYSSEESILHAIDTSRSTAQRCLERATACDNERAAHYKTLHELEVSHGKATKETLRDAIRHSMFDIQQNCDRLKKEAQRLSRKRHGIANNRLPKLSVALAQFRTTPMSAITNDPSVCV